MPCLEMFQAARVNGIIQDVPMVGVSHGQDRSDLRCFLQLRRQYLVLHGSPVEGGLALKARNSHLGNRWILTCKDGPMETKAPKVLCRSGDLRVRDVLRCLHIQEQSGYTGERNHLTTYLYLHEDHFGLKWTIACLGLQGKFEFKVGFTPGGGLYVWHLVQEAQAHQR